MNPWDFVTFVCRDCGCIPLLERYDYYICIKVKFRVTCKCGNTVYGKITQSSTDGAIAHAEATACAEWINLYGRGVVKDMPKPCVDKETKA